MTEQTQTTPVLELKKIYLKDASFESPKAPYSFSADFEEPVISVEITINSKRLDKEKNYYEVVLNITATAKLEKEEGHETVYLCEVQQAGVFVLSHPNPQNLDAMQGIACPAILLPYAREVIHSLTGKGGFDPLMINPMNFEAAYIKKKQLEMQKEQQQAANQSQDNASNQEEQTTSPSAESEDKPTLN